MKVIYSTVCIALALSSCKNKDQGASLDEKSQKAVADSPAIESQKIAPTKVTLEKVEASKGADPKLVKRCQVAIAKVFLDTMMADKPAPIPKEQAVIDLVRTAATDNCIKEGLSLEQAACFDTIADLKSLQATFECPAIAEAPPSWLRSYTSPKSEKEESKE